MDTTTHLTTPHATDQLQASLQRLQQLTHDHHLKQLTLQAIRLETGEGGRFTSPQARQNIHDLCARLDALMQDIGRELAELPQMPLGVFNAYEDARALSAGTPEDALALRQAMFRLWQGVCVLLAQGSVTQPTLPIAQPLANTVAAHLVHELESNSRLDFYRESIVHGARQLHLRGWDNAVYVGQYASGTTLWRIPAHVFITASVDRGGHVSLQTG